MNAVPRDTLADITLAFLIGAGFGIGAMLLMQDDSATRKRRAFKRRLRKLRDIDHDIRSVLAVLRDR